MNQENQPAIPMHASEGNKAVHSEAMTSSSISTSASNSIPSPYTAAPASAGGHGQVPGIFPTTSIPTASLYVGELSPDVNESMLFELFSQIGPVASIRVCRDAVTRRSLGYAYVNFHSMLDGERALDTLNYTTIKGQPCRIMWSQRDPSLRRSGQGNIFIKDLEKTIDNKALHDTFSVFGNILSCKVVTDENGESKGYGFVHFETQEAADLAIEKVNGMLLNDKKVYVGRHISRRERISKKEESKARFTNVYVKNLDASIDDAELRVLFTPFGEITSAVVQRDEASSFSKGFGFVNFADHHSALAAVAEMTGKVIKDKQLYVCRAQSKAERAEELRRQFEAFRQERLAKFQGVNLYVKNLEESIDDTVLREEFAPFGTIVSCKVMRDEKDLSKGFGFVCYTTPEEAIKAQAEMNGKLILGKPIFVAMAQRKEERRMALESQFSQRLGYLRAGMVGMPSAGAPQGVAHGGMIPGLFYHHPHPQHPAMMSAPQRIPYHPIPQQVLYSSASRRFVNRPVSSAPSSSSTAMRTAMGNSTSPLHQGGGMTSEAAIPRRAYNSRQRPGQQQGPSAAPFSGSRKNVSFSPKGGPSMRGGRGAGRYPSHTEYQSQFNAPGNASVLIQALASASPETQKSMIGELLYPMIESYEPSSAAKVTGMLLDMDNADLLHLLESPDLLSSKVTQAVQLLQEAGRT